MAQSNAFKFANNILTNGGFDAADLVGAANVGKVLQVVNATYNVSTSATTNTFITTGLNVSITPTSASNKILILVNQTGLRKDGNGYLRLKLQRVTTDIANFDWDGGYTGTSGTNSIGGTGICYLDTPNTTSSTNYRTVFNNQGNASTVYVQVSASVSSMTLMEIAV